jgi:hypothetical protein
MIVVFAAVLLFCVDVVAKATTDHAAYRTEINVDVIGHTKSVPHGTKQAVDVLVVDVPIGVKFAVSAQKSLLLIGLPSFLKSRRLYLHDGVAAVIRNGVSSNRICSDCHVNPGVMAIAG